MDVIDLYRMMARSRAFELVQADLWRQGLISGEMHQGTGEEGVIAGVVTHLRNGDAVSLDHRPSSAMLLLGVPAVAILREMLGRPDGLCGGCGGHMHLFSPGHLVASSGIVGASAPLAVGFALAAKRLRPGGVAVAFFGDGAVNQGMVLEAWNLAAVWSLPVLFVCQINGWAVTTRTDATTGGDLVARARAFGLEAERVDGSDIRAVHATAGRLIERARRHGVPSFLASTCLRLEGHFLGDPLLAVADHPVSQGQEVLGPMLSAATSTGGGTIAARAHSLFQIMNATRLARRAGRELRRDPLVRARSELPGADTERIDREAAEEMAVVVATALQEGG